MAISVKTFLDTVFLGQTDRAWVCSVKSEKHSGISHNFGWKGGRRGDVFMVGDEGHYYSLGLIKPGATRKASENWDGATMMVLDDVGEKSVPAQTIVDTLGNPTFIVRTSPKSEQWGYVFTTEVKDVTIAARLQKACTLKFYPSGVDPGQEPVVQYMRLPSGVNDKDKHTDSGRNAPPEVELGAWEPANKFEPLDLMQALGDAWTQTAGLVVSTSANTLGRITQEQIAGYVKHDPVLSGLDALGRLVGPQGNTGFIEVQCPWDHLHSVKDHQTGYNPAKRQFKCPHADHHGDGIKTTQDIRAWLEQQTYPDGKTWLDILNGVQTGFAPVADSSRGAPRPMRWITTDEPGLPDAEKTVMFLGARNTVAQLIGAAAGGKSMLLVAVCGAISHDREDLLPNGIVKERAGDMLIVTNEDTEGQYRKRFQAWEAVHGLSATGRTRGIAVMEGIVAEKVERFGHVALTERWKEIAQRIEASGKFWLVALDTQNTVTQGLEENSSGDIGALKRLFTAEAKRLKVCIAFVQHVAKANKSTEGSGDQTLGRGSGAGFSAARTVTTMVRLSDAEKKNGPADVESYFWVHGAKSNHGEKLGKTLWRTALPRRAVKDDEYMPGQALSEKIPVAVWEKTIPAWLLKPAQSEDALTWLLQRIEKSMAPGGEPLLVAAGKKNPAARSAREILAGERQWLEQDVAVLLKRAEAEGLIQKTTPSKHHPQTWENTIAGSKRSATYATAFDETPKSVDTF